MQTQTQVPPALQVLLSMGAQPTAPGPMGRPIPSVAMQKAQEQPQGLPEMAMAAGQAAPSVMRNMEMQKFQQMLEQAMQARQQQAPGIAGLPAQNMQFADGGVVGYAEGGTPRTYGYAPDYEDARRMGINLSPYDSPEVRKEKLDRLQKMREFEASPDRGVAIPTEASQANERAIAQAFSPSAQQTRMRDIAPRPAPPVPTPSPEAQAMMRQQGPRAGIADPRLAATRTAAPRSEAPARTAPTAAPATGIATALPAVMTPEEAMASARAGLGIPGTADLRAANMEAKQAREQMPATGQAGLAALQEQMAAVKRMEEERKRSMASDRVIAQLLGGRGRPGGLAEADIKFMAGQRAAEDAFYERNVALAAKQDAINDANEARKVGNKEKYAEAMKNLSDAERAIAQAEATYAAAILTNAGTVRGQNVQIQEGALDRASRERIAREGVTARAAGAGARGVITPKDLAKFRMQAEQQVDKALQEDAAFRRLRNDPTAQAAYREDKIKARVREALVAADYDLPAGYEKPAAPAAGAANDPLGIRKP